MLGLPLIALYFVAVGLAYLFGPKESGPAHRGERHAAERDDALAGEKTPPPLDVDAIREAKIRDHEAKVAAKIAAKIAAAKANEPEEPEEPKGPKQPYRGALLPAAEHDEEGLVGLEGEAPVAGLSRRISA
ncbi:MAG: hypothetical protein IPF99_27155 [Deltaproteobacteria bacterium]|nr:hypothetical protein [Deltaproteobacteria bacterium]